MSGNVRTDNDDMYLLCAIEQQQQKNPVKHSPHNPTDSIWYNLEIYNRSDILVKNTINPGNIMKIGPYMREITKHTMRDIP